MNERPTLEVELVLTPEEHAEGGEFPLEVRRKHEKVKLMVQVPAGFPADGVLRLRDIPIGPEHFDLLVSPVVRRLLPTWPVTLIGNGVFLWGWFSDRSPVLLFGGLLLIGMGLYGQFVGHLPIAGKRTRPRDLLFLLWLIVVAMAVATGLNQMS